ncbi:MAG: hypothetical protein JSR33_02755 [Proteobacteria bacterium]|nr:hypothetical protein [Pseudomonadota bacterium]
MKKTIILKILLSTLSALIICLGLYNAYQTSSSLYYINSDVVDTGLLWQGVHQYGWSFLKSWNYNVDNWLLSLFPIHFVLFEIFGADTIILVWFGYIVYLLNILLCSAIAYQLGAKKSSFFIILLLLFGNYYLFFAGFITYPISHNSTNLYGLFSILLIIKWLKSPKYIYLFLIFFSCLLPACSDPWFLPNYLLPMIITQFCFLKKDFPLFKADKSSILLTILLLLSLLITYTHFFGILSFTTQKHNVFINFFQNHNENGKMLIRNIGYFINFIPTNLTNLQSAKFSWTVLGSFIIICIALAILSNIIIKYNTNPYLSRFLMISGLSVFFSILSYSFLDTRFLEIYSGRYLINIPLFIVMAMVIAIEFFWNKINFIIKTIFSILLILYLTSSIYSTISLWNKKYDLSTSQYGRLANFLIQNDLNYGYADYWQANMVTWLFHKKIAIRPLVFNSNGMIVSDMNLQTSKLWYQKSDLPKNNKNIFIIVDKKISKCTDQQSCTLKLAQQFGLPKKILSYNEEFIMVWDHPLLEMIKS